MKTIELKVPFCDEKFKISGSEKDKSIIGTIECNNGFYEPHLMNLLPKILRPNGIYLDIGANIGVITLALSKLAKQGKVYAFEPSQNNFEFLKLNIEQNQLDNVSPINLGIFDRNCEMEFSYVETVAGCSFMSESGVKEGICEQIKCLRLDEWVDETEIKKIDLVKMDVEGAEIKAINGGINTFKEFNPNLIIEFNPNPMERFFDQKPESLYQLLSKLYSHIYLIPDNSKNLIEIQEFNQLNEIIKKGKGWEDLLCSNQNFHIEA
ncbi:MAG: FkbM family methyltransferase [Candidatus Thermoplasmatota archaeon]|nr:FkbM family methyltransferase [Candidatus Thermoplasmatota archaeon]